MTSRHAVFGTVAYTASQLTYTDLAAWWTTSLTGHSRTSTHTAIGRRRNRSVPDTRWTHKGKPVDQLPDDCVGFVYVITNTQNGRMYIGKKLAKFKTTRYKMHTQKNGKKVRKRIRGAVSSDWQDYYGSSDALAKDLQQLGKEKFVREILYYCNSKAECNYVEAREQFNRKVLESDQYYNGHIRVRVHGSLIIGKI